jgi:hypothetical protein
VGSSFVAASFKADKLNDRSARQVCSHLYLVHTVCQQRKVSKTICRLPWNYSFLRRTLKWACCCDCPEQSIGIYSLGSSLKCVGLEYKPWYRDMGPEFKDLAPSSHSCKIFSSLYTLYMWVCFAFLLPITFLRLFFFVFQFFYFALDLSFTMKFLSFWLCVFSPFSLLVLSFMVKIRDQLMEFSNLKQKGTKGMCPLQENQDSKKICLPKMLIFTL